jgi:putative transposase
VLVTKERRPCLNEEIHLWLEDEFIRLLSKQDCRVHDFKGKSDHVHALIEMHPAVAPAAIINSLKTVTSRMLKKHFAEHLKKYYVDTNAGWSRSYCLLSAPGSHVDINKYVENH